MARDYIISARHAIKDQVEVFKSICNDIKNSKGVETDGKHLCSWSEIEKKLVEKKVNDYNRRLLKDQWFALIKKYKVWSHLVNDAPTSNESTFVHKKLTAAWWGNYLKRNPEARQFRFTPLVCVEELKSLFGDSTEDLKSEENDDAAFDDAESDSSPGKNDDAESDSSPGKNDDTGPAHIKHKKPHYLHKNSSMDFDDQLERVLKTVKRSDETSLEECNKVLDGTKKLKMDNPLYIAACTIFCESQTHREQWMMLSKKPEEVRISWLLMIAKKLGLV